MRIRSIVPALGAAALATSLMAAPAPAADYPVLRGSQIEDAPPPPDININWSGFYFGAFAGGTQTRFESDNGVRELADFAMLNTTIATRVNIRDMTATRPRRDSGTGRHDAAEPRADRPRPRRGVRACVGSRGRGGHGLPRQAVRPEAPARTTRSAPRPTPRSTSALARCRKWSAVLSARMFSAVSTRKNPTTPSSR